MPQQPKILFINSLKAYICFLLLCCCTLLCKAQSDSTLQGFSPFKFGAAVNVNLLKSSSQYRALVTREYNSLTGENAMKFGTLHTSQNGYAFKDGDTLVNFAQATNKRVHGHTLIWYNSLPTWVTNFVGDSAAWENLMKTHIDTVVKHFKGKVTSWDVVNEAFNDDGTLRSSVWLTNLGANYIARAFQYAHNADPNALLFYNDYGHEYSSAKLLAIKNLAANFLANNVPIDGIGMQLHVNKNTSNNNISNAIDSMLATGLKVHIAEFDVAVNPANDQTLTYDSASASLLFGKYKFIARYAKKIAANKLYGITTWNVTDGDSWIPSNYSRPDFPLPFSSNYQKKTAFTAIKDALTKQWDFDASSGQSFVGTYTDLGTTGNLITTGFTGNAIGTDNDNSSVQNIGFNFAFNGSLYNQFVLNTNGYIKLGASAPSANSIFYPTVSANAGSVITTTDIDLIYPYNHDLKSGALTPEYRVATTGVIGARVCTIQFKNVADKIAPVQYTNMEFQIKLYEGSNAIEFIYGNWVASASTSTLITGAVGLKGINADESINIAKGSSVTWATAVSTANNFYFRNGDYASTGPQFSTRNGFLPDAGRTFRFVPTTTLLPVTFIQFSGTIDNVNAYLHWVTANEVNNSGFEIQRSFDGINFIAIGNVVSKREDASANNYYSFIDIKPTLTNIIYYRLRQIDNNGFSTFSKVISLSSNTNYTTKITIQNPISATILVTINSQQSQQIVFVLTDNTGRTIWTKHEAISSGINNINIPTPALSAGLYMLSVNTPNNCKTFKLLKQ